jgi:hypothetical protein
LAARRTTEIFQTLSEKFESDLEEALILHLELFLLELGTGMDAPISLRLPSPRQISITPDRLLICLEVDFPIAPINAFSNLEGNADQYITMYWGKPNAPSTSSGPAVFNNINGTIDEARLCNVARSPAWIKLEYENQKANQTLVQQESIKSEEIVYTDGEIVLEYNTIGQMTRVTIDFDGEGRMEKDKNGGSWDVHYRFYVKDHLGSTRVVLNGDAPQSTPVQSMAYDPYGKLISLADQAAEHTTREQFTGKELDMDGAANSIDFNVIVRNIQDPYQSRDAWITLYYSDGSNETIPMEASADGVAVWLNAAFGFKDGRILSQVRFTCNTSGHTIFDHWYDCLDQVISGNVHYKITLLNPDNNANPLPVNAAPMTTSSFISIAEDANPVAFGGMGVEYFGRRYYDPSLTILMRQKYVPQLT